MTDSAVSESYINQNSTMGSSVILNGRTSPHGRNLPRSTSGDMDGDHEMKVRESVESQGKQNSVVFCTRLCHMTTSEL